MQDTRCDTGNVPLAFAAGDATRAPNSITPVPWAHFGLQENAQKAAENSKLFPWPLPERHHGILE